MDIEELASSSETRLELLHPKTGEKTGMVLHGVTPDSGEYQVLRHKVFGRQVAQSLILGTKKNEGARIEIPADQSEKDRQLLILSITDIKGAESKGKPKKFDRKSIDELLSQPEYWWITDQWREHTSDRTEFFSTPARSAKAG